MATNLRAKEPGRVITGGQAQASNPHIAAKVNASLPRQQKDLVDVFKGWGNKSPNQANPNKNKGLFGKFVDSLDASNVGGVNSPFSTRGFDESKRKGIALKDDLNKLKDFSMINALIKAGKGAADAIGGGIKNVITPPVTNKYADWSGRGGMNEGMSGLTSDFGQSNVAQSYIDPSQVIPTTPSHTGQFAPEMMTGMNPPQNRGVAPPQRNHPDAGQWWVNPNTYTPPAPAGGGSINWDYGEGLSRGAGNPDFAQRQGTAEGFYNMHPETSSSTFSKGTNYPYDNWLQYQRNLSGMDTSVPLPLMDGNVDTMGSVMNNGGLVYANQGMAPLSSLSPEQIQLLTPEDWLAYGYELDRFGNPVNIEAHASGASDVPQGYGMPYNNGGVVHARGGAYVPEVESFSPQATPRMEKDTTGKEIASTVGGAAGSAVGGPIGGTIGSAMGSYLFNSGGHVNGPLSLKSQTTTQKLDYS